jgi:hypothetical protein
MGDTPPVAASTSSRRISRSNPTLHRAGFRRGYVRGGYGQTNPGAPARRHARHHSNQPLGRLTQIQTLHSGRVLAARVSIYIEP